MEFLFLWIGCGVIAAIVASNKGRGPIAWFFIGFLFGPFGLIASFVVSNVKAARAAAAEIANSKACPECAERVRKEALKCRHCGYRFDAEQPRVSADGSGPRSLADRPANREESAHVSSVASSDDDRWSRFDKR